MRIRADMVVMDYDRTVADENLGFMIDPEVKGELMRERGFKLVLATGRKYDEIPDRDIRQIFDFVLSENGTILHTKGGGEKEVLVKGSWEETRNKLARSLDELGVYYFKGEVILAGLIADIKGFNDAVSKSGVRDAISYEYNKEGLLIMPKGWNKGRGLMAIKGLIGSKRICAIGDDLNDISLFEAAEIKVAVKNAVSRIMEEADIVCENEDGKGVIEIIRAIEWL